MALFSKRSKAVVPASVIASLADYGRAIIAEKRSGSPLDDSRFGWNYLAPVMTAMSGGQSDQVIQELYDAARTAANQPMATVGAYKLLSEWNGDQRDERFLALRDAYLSLMREMRFSSGHLTGYEAQRWVELHGELRSSFDGPA